MTSNQDIHESFLLLTTEKEQYRNLAEQANIQLQQQNVQIKTMEDYIEDIKNKYQDCLTSNEYLTKNLIDQQDYLMQITTEKEQYRKMTQEQNVQIKTMEDYIENIKKENTILTKKLEDVEERLEACLIMNPVPNMKI